MNDQLKLLLAKMMIGPFVPRQISAPEGTKCTECGSNDVIATCAPRGVDLVGKLRATLVRMLNLSYHIFQRPA